MHFAFHPHGIKFPERKRIMIFGNQSKCIFINYDARTVFFIHSFQSRSQIYDVADRGVIKTFFLTDISHNCRSARDSNAEIQFYQFFF